MYYEHETVYDLGQHIYRLTDSNTINTWKIIKVESLCTFEEGKESPSFRTNYKIQCITHPEYMDKLHCQNELSKFYFKDKKDLIKRLMEQI